jgi:uncharacterized membrane protein
VNILLWVILIVWVAMLIMYFCECYRYSKYMKQSEKKFQEIMKIHREAIKEIENK